MSDIRPADVMYSDAIASASPPPPTAPAGTPREELRPADALWGPPPPPPPQPRVVAKATSAKTDGEIMYESSPDDQQRVSNDGPDEANQPGEPNEQDLNEERPRDLIQVSPDIAIAIDPDRFTTFDQEGLDRLAPIFEEYEIKGAAAQKLFDLHLERIEAEGEAAQHALHQALQEQHQATVSGWLQTLKADPELQSYGLDNVRASSRAVLSQFFDADIRAALKDYGLTNHPGLIKGLLRMQEHVHTQSMRQSGYEYKPKIRPLAPSGGKRK